MVLTLVSALALASFHPGVLAVGAGLSAALLFASRRFVFGCDGTAPQPAANLRRREPLLLQGRRARPLASGLRGNPHPRPLPRGEVNLLVPSAVASALSRALPYLADALMFLGLWVMIVGMYGVI
jgi:hypothetical protein